MEIQTCRIKKFSRNVSLFICFLSGCLSFATSCQSGRVKSKLENFIGCKIMMPESFCIDTSAHINLIAYYAPENCISCKIKGLYRWDELLLAADSLSDFNITFIFQTDTLQNHEDFNITFIFQTDTLQNHDIESLHYPVILDSNAYFLRANPSIPTDSRYHPFLLDRNNRVVRVGNPLSSDAMWSLFRKTLDNMLAHDGVYVPDK